MAWTAISIFGLTVLLSIVNATKHPRIYGGDDAKIQFFPYQVSIRELYGQHFCGGAIISNRHILTAAHCVEDEDLNLIKVHTGTYKSDKRGNVHDILSVRIHPKWKLDDEKGYPNDIAVITLKNPIDFDKYQNKVNLPHDDIRTFETAYVTGWGYTKNGKISKNLQKIRVELIPSDECQPLLKEHTITHKQICSFKARGIGLCNGDSGGPLVANGEVVGIVSFKDTEECAAGQPDVHTNVFAYKNFIESAMNE